MMTVSDFEHTGLTFLQPDHVIVAQWSFLEGTVGAWNLEGLLVSAKSIRVLM